MSPIVTALDLNRYIKRLWVISRIRIFFPKNNNRVVLTRVNKSYITGVARLRSSLSILLNYNLFCLQRRRTSRNAKWSIHLDPWFLFAPINCVSHGCKISQLLAAGCQMKITVIYLPFDLEYYLLVEGYFFLLRETRWRKSSSYSTLTDPTCRNELPIYSTKVVSGKPYRHHVYFIAVRCFSLLL